MLGFGLELGLVLGLGGGGGGGVQFSSEAIVLEAMLGKTMTDLLFFSLNLSRSQFLFLRLKFLFN